MTQTADGYMRKYAAKEAKQAESARQSRTAKIADALGYIEEQLPEEILEVLSVSGVGGYDPSAVGVANSRVVVSGAVTLEIGGPRDTEEVPLKVTGPIGGAGSIKASYDSNHAVELRAGGHRGFCYRQGRWI